MYKALISRTTKDVTDYDCHLDRTPEYNNPYIAKATPKILKEQTPSFASALVHEFRNPLANINLSVGMLESTIKDTELKTYLDIIIRSSERINHLIKDLLKYQQEEKIPIVKNSIHKLLDEVIELAKDRISLKNISVCKVYADQEMQIEFDRPGMKIGLTNIIINAIEAMGTERGELKLVTKSIGGKYVILIEDNGCGISKENLKFIFSPYYTNKPDGLGLGLTTTFEILRSNHVEVKVESEIGHGTRFILFFNKNNIKEAV